MPRGFGDVSSGTGISDEDIVNAKDLEIAMLREQLAEMEELNVLLKQKAALSSSSSTGSVTQSSSWADESESDVDANRDIRFMKNESTCSRNGFKAALEYQIHCKA